MQPHARERTRLTHSTAYDVAIIIKQDTRVQQAHGLTLFLGRTEVQLLEEVTQPLGRNYAATGFGTPCVQRLSANRKRNQAETIKETYYMQPPRVNNVQWIHKRAHAYFSVCDSQHRERERRACPGQRAAMFTSTLYTEYTQPHTSSSRLTVDSQPYFLWPI